MFDRLRAGLQRIAEKITTKGFSEKEIEQTLESLRFTLSENDIASQVIDEILDRLKGEIEEARVKRGTEGNFVKSQLRKILIEIIQRPGTIDFLEVVRTRQREGKPLNIAFVGVNGTGKTTTIAKVAHMLTKKGFSALLVSGDTFRAGAEEQLETHAERLGLRVMKHGYGADPAAVAYDALEYANAHGINVVLLDTAGRMQTDKGLMDELRKVVRVAPPDLIIYVGDSLAGNDALNQALEFDKAVGISAVILTKADADAKGGAAISINHSINKPVLYLGTGQGYDDLKRFDAEWFVGTLLGPPIQEGGQA